MATNTILMAGSLAQRPGYGGHASVFLQYIAGFRRLGWDIFFLDWLDDSMCRDRAGNRCAVGDSWYLADSEGVMRQHGLDDAWSLNCNHGRQTLARWRNEDTDAARRAKVLSNVMGFLGCISHPRLGSFFGALNKAPPNHGRAKLWASGVNHVCGVKKPVCQPSLV